MSGQLSGLSWKLPCLSTGTPCACSSTIDDQATLQAPAGASYLVLLRIRGVVEQQTYSGGTQQGSWYIGGTPTDPTGNTYRLQISDPPQTYYINASGSAGSVVSLDYKQTIIVNAGATVDLYANSGDSFENPNSSNLTVADDDPARPIVVSQPYNGQFAQMDVLSLIPVGVNVSPGTIQEGDISLIWDQQNQRGDFAMNGSLLQTGGGLYTAYLISIFTDRIANPDDVIPDGTDDPRGWCEDDPEYPIGSRLWLLYRGKNTQDTLNKALEYTTEAVQWLIDDGIVAKHDISVEYLQQGGLGIEIIPYRQDGTKLPALKYQYLWTQL